MLKRYLRKLVEPTPQKLDGTRVPLEFSLCYKLRRDALEITAQMLGDSSADASDVRTRRLIWVQSRLLEAMCSDPEISDRQRDVLMAFHNKALRDMISDRRGARRRGSFLSHAP